MAPGKGVHLPGLPGRAWTTAADAAPRRTVLAGVLVAVLVSLVAACGPAESSLPRRGGTLTVVLPPGALAHIDPQRLDDPETAALLGAYIFRTLMAYPATADAASRTVVPDLAVGAPDVSTDRTTWTFRLRADVTFDNARPVTCADIKHGVARNFARELGNDGSGAVSVLDIPRDGDGGSLYLGPYATGSADGAAAFDLAVACATDGSVITFHLREPTGNFDERVAQPAFAPVPVESDIGLQYEERPVGTGPYRVEENGDGRLQLVRSSQWNGLSDAQRPAYPDVITVLEATDLDLATREILSGGAAGSTVAGGNPGVSSAATAGPALSAPLLDALVAEGHLTTGPAPEAAAQAVAVTLASGPDGWVRHLAVDVRRVTDVAARTAIQLAVDRLGVRDALIGVTGGDLTGSLLPPGLAPDGTGQALWTALGDVPARGDPAAAQAMLQSAQSPPGPLTLDYPDTASDAAAAASVAADLQAIGLEVTIRPVPLSSYAEHLRSRDLTGELVMVDYAPDPLSGVQTVQDLLAGDGVLNVSRWGDERSELAIAVARQSTDPLLRAVEVAAIVDDALLDGVAVPLVAYRTLRIAGGDVGGAQLNPRNGFWAYADLWVLG